MIIKITVLDPGFDPAAGFLFAMLLNMTISTIGLMTFSRKNRFTCKMDSTSTYYYYFVFYLLLTRGFILLVFNFYYCFPGK